MQLAYNSGRLTESHEILRLGGLRRFYDVQLRAAILEREMAAGAVPRKERVYSRLARSWLAQEFDKTIEPLEHGSELASAGAPFERLGPRCTISARIRAHGRSRARSAIRKGACRIPPRRNF